MRSQAHLTGLRGYSCIHRNVIGLAQSNVDPVKDIPLYAAMATSGPVSARTSETSRARPAPRTMLVHVTGDRIGDALLKYPALRAFRAACPETRITWTTSRNPSVFATRLAPLAAGLIDELHPVTGLARSPWASRPIQLSSHYDVIVASESRLRETLVLRRIGHDAFISPTWRFAFSSCKPTRDYAGGSVYERFAMLMSFAAGVELVPDPVIDIPRSFTEMAATLLPPGGVYVAFCPGAGGANKRWPPGRYVELARRQAARGRVPVFFLGPEEQDLRATIAENVPDARLPELAAAAQGMEGPLVTIALAARARVAVSSDSGGGHLMSAGGSPVVKLYSNARADKFKSPYGEQIALEAGDYGGPDVAAIPVDAVDAALETALSRPA